jgi:hypothetical protein
LEHTRQRSVFVAAVLVSASWACGDARAPSGSSTPEGTQASENAGSAAAGSAATSATVDPNAPSGTSPEGIPAADAPLLELSLDGRAQPMGARAALNVKEGEPAVRLSITATDGGDDLLILSVTFNGLDGSLGAHSFAASLPNAGDGTASADLAGLPYHSQAGEIDLSLSADGPLTGTFALSMAHDADTVTGAGSGVQPSTDLLPLSGQFTGSWVLSCESYLPGHHVLVVGGSYCDNLAF